MATTKKTAETTTETVEAVEETTEGKKLNKGTYDWDDLREITLPFPRGDEEKEWFVSVNGRNYQVPCGSLETVPYPIYERCRIRLEQYQKEQRYRNEIPNDTTVKSI